MLTNPLFKQFESGDYQSVIKSCESKKVPAQGMPWYIGALSFLGRLDEARGVFENWEKEETLPLEARVISYFFLGISRVRHADTKSGLQYLKKNWAILHQVERTPLTDFFTHQGISFWYFFQGKMKKSEFYSRKSLAAAIEAKFNYGLFLSHDLRGHALLELGKITEGLASLNQALIKARHQKNSKTLQSLESSILIESSVHGVRGDLEAKLNEMFSELAVDDSYTASSLLMELARQSILKGSLTQADDYLKLATEVIYRTMNFRHKILINVIRINLLLRKGEGHQALSLIDSFKRTVLDMKDPSLLIKVLGLEYKALTFLGLSPKEDLFPETLRKHPTFNEKALNQRILARHGLVLAHYPQGEDLLGDLMDKVTLRPLETVDQCIQQGYLGLLHECLSLPYGSSKIVFGLAPRSVTIFDQGSVSHITALTPQQFKILGEIAKQKAGLEDLVTHIWGYQYDPLRHDGLVYSAMNQLKKSLQSMSTIIERQDHGYGFLNRFSVLFIGKEETPSMETNLDAPFNLESEDLNFRQIQILKWFKKSPHKSLSIQQVKDLLNISTMTAHRDLKGLCLKHKLKALGKARATVYVLRD